MKQRALLRRQIIRAWCRTIRDNYGTINSERSLQAALWHHLHALFKQAGKLRQILIEPCVILTGDKERVYPDLVICNSRTVIGVIELKYLPRGAPKHEKDMNTLRALQDERGTISIKNERYRGELSNRHEYRLAQNVLFVWAGLYSRDHAGDWKTGSLVERTMTTPLAGRFLELHALTASGERPRIEWRPELPNDTPLRQRFRRLID